LASGRSAVTSACSRDCDVHRSRIDNFVVGLDPLQANLRSRRQAERRQVSVLFCDLVGSTELAHRLDPEELAPIIDRYHATAAETVRQMGGHVARLLGDGVMAYFGWPTVREDDAERAVAAGLELIETVSRLPTVNGETLAVRVGVATGLVAIGYGTEAGDGGISGDTPNIAARLQAEADANTLVVAPLTARLAGRSFRYKNLGERTLRGLTSPLEIFEVSGTRSSLNRFKALRARSTGPLVGRSEEVELMLSRWRRATASEGQVVLLSGDAGIGKSRLVQSTRERIGAATVMSYQCSRSTRHAMFPVVYQLTRSIRSATSGRRRKGRQGDPWLRSVGLGLATTCPCSATCCRSSLGSPAVRAPQIPSAWSPCSRGSSSASPGAGRCWRSSRRAVDRSDHDHLIDILRNIGRSRAALFIPTATPFRRAGTWRATRPSFASSA
jgi:class 3 adenylate cyclase